jgi:hypothetical protein
LLTASLLTGALLPATLLASTGTGLTAASLTTAPTRSLGKLNAVLVLHLRRRGRRKSERRRRRKRNGECFHLVSSWFHLPINNVRYCNLFLRAEFSSAEQQFVCSFKR